MIDAHDLDAAVASVSGSVVAWRRHFHQHPELSFKEFETSAFIYETLESFGGLELSRPTETSVVAKLKGGKPGKTLAIRADIDALALSENNDLDFASVNEGCMHACGHDSHAAMLLGTAKVLSLFKDEIPGEIRFFFQHAEEVPPGGASQMVAAGVMEGVDLIIGLHVGPQYPAGTVAIAPGPISGDGMNCWVKVLGKGGHSAMPELSNDPVIIGAEIVVNLQHIVARRTSAFENLIVAATRFNTPGEAYNVIPDHATIGLNARGVSADFRKKVPQMVEQIVKGITAAHGATYEMGYEFSYPSVVNDPEVTERWRTTAVRLFGEDKVVVMKPTMGGEDFSAFLTKAPGCFVFLGAGNPEKGASFPNHHPKFNIDEDALAVGVRLFVHGAFDLLS